MIVLNALFGLALCEAIQCPEGQGIDSFTGECIYCSIYNGILEDGHCGICPDFYGIDRLTGKCVQCADNECIDILRRCVVPGENISIDPISRFCKCPAFEGHRHYDYDVVKCFKCEPDYCVSPHMGKCISISRYNYGIDPKNGQCITCKNGKGIHPYTRDCVYCPEGSTLDDYKMCQIPQGFGIDYETNKLIECKDGEHILDNYSCGICPKRYGVDSFNKCVKCSSNYGVDPDTLKCRYINSDEGINYETGFIMKCPEGSTKSGNYCKCPKDADGNAQGILSDGTCGRCNADDNMGILSNYFCGKCEKDQEINQYGSCSACSGDTYYNLTTKKCENKQQSSSYCRIYNPNSYHVWQYVLHPQNTIIDDNICKCINESLQLDINTLECRESGPGDMVMYDNLFVYACPWTNCIDPSTLECRTPKQFEIIDQTSHMCRLCDDEEGIVHGGRKCMKCKYSECISEYDGKCIQVLDGLIKDPISKKCKCPEQEGYRNNLLQSCKKCSEKEGINPENHGICEICSPNQCIDRQTRKCREFNGNEGYDIDTNECVSCPNDAVFDVSIGQCKCSGNKGFNSKSGLCVPCNEGEGIDPNTQQCVVCEIGQTIISGICSYCPPKEGLDLQNGQCGPCKEGEGILPIINVCGQCPGNSTLNTENNKCECNIGFIKESSGQCIKCPINTFPNENQTKCDYVSNSYCVDPMTFKIVLISSLENMVKNPVTSMCTSECPEGSTKYYHDYYKYSFCECDDEKKGISSDFSSCIDCGLFGALDFNNMCTQCEEDYCIDPSTHRCKYIPSYSNNYINGTTGECIDGCENGHLLNSRLCKCPENAIHQDGNCYCDVGEGIIEPGYTCGVCPFRQGISNDKCVDVLPGKCIDPEYRVISDAYSKGINATTLECVRQCNVGEGIDPVTRYCGPCKDDECIDIYDDVCRKPLIGELIDSDTKQCICPDFYGINKRIGKCEKCEPPYCKDSFTGQCQLTNSFSNNEYIDPLNGQCLRTCSVYYDPYTRLCGICANGTIKGRDKCLCPPKQGVLSTSYECGYCPDGQSIDPETNRCGPCKNKGVLEIYGINPETNICEKCSDDKGIDPVTGICDKCKDKEGLNGDNRICGPCRPNEGILPGLGRCTPCLYPNKIDLETNKCLCIEGFGYNKYYECVDCESGIDPDTYKCIDCSSLNLGIDHKTRLCRNCTDDEHIDPLTKECINNQTTPTITPDDIQMISISATDEYQITPIFSADSQATPLITADDSQTTPSLTVDDSQATPLITTDNSQTTPSLIVDDSQTPLYNETVLPPQSSSPRPSKSTTPIYDETIKENDVKNITIKDPSNINSEIQDAFSTNEWENGKDQVIVIVSEDKEISLSLNMSDNQYIQPPTGSTINLDDGNLNIVLPSTEEKPVKVVVDNSKDVNLSIKGGGNMAIQTKNQINDEIKIMPKSEIDSSLDIQLIGEINTIIFDSINLHKSKNDVPLTIKAKKEDQTPVSIVVNHLEAKPNTVASLSNIDISQSLIVTQSASLALDNVGLKDTNVLLHMISKSNTNEPLLTGNFPDLPKHFSLKRDNDSLPPENDQFKIISGDFDCEEWKNLLVIDGTGFNTKECNMMDESKILNDAQYLTVSNSNHKNNIDKSNKLTGGQIAGIVVGCVAAVIIAVIVVFIVIRKKTRNDYQDSSNENDLTDSE